MNVVAFGEKTYAGHSEALARVNAHRLLGNEKVDVSFEFFPPHSPSMEQRLWRSIKRLEPLGPRHIAITSGGDAVTRQRTHAIVARVMQEAQIDIAPHITCRDSSRQAIDRILEHYWRMGVRHIVAIRGDKFNGEEPRSIDGGYDSVVALVRGILRVAPFQVTVAAYPEKHPRAQSISSDLDALKQKIDAGATSAITQYFFDNSVFFRFLDRARAAGISIPIIPGLLPIQSLAQVVQVCARCSVSIPPALTLRLQDIEDDPETRRYAAAAFSAEQILDLVRGGVSGVHFFTLNRADLVYGICHMIGLRSVNLR